MHALTQFLVVSLIENVFIQIIPVPKPRGVELDDRSVQRAGCAARRRARLELEAESVREKVRAQRAMKSKGAPKDDAGDPGTHSCMPH